jgi:N-acetylmuramoyl-L-alanine amidase
MMNPSIKARREIVAEQWCKRFNRGTNLHDCKELSADIRVLSEVTARAVLTELGFVEHESGGWALRIDRPTFSRVLPKAVWERLVE